MNISPEELGSIATELEANISPEELGSIATELEAELCRKSFAEFCKSAWHVIEPAKPLMWGKHLEAMADHLQAVSEGKITRLIINVPPGHAKSSLVSVLWQAWEWTRNPQIRVISASYAKELATRDAGKTRRLIESDWYQSTFKPKWSLRGDQNVKTRFENTESGGRQATSVGAGTTGFRGNRIIIDDPLKADEWPSLDKLKTVASWWSFQMSSRLNDIKRDAVVLIMQRLHEKDLTGYLLAKEPGAWEHLCLPSEYDPESAKPTSIGWKDWRTKPGELLFPELFPRDILEKLKETLGDYGYAGQHEQRPTPPKGGIFKRDYLHFYNPETVDPRDFENVIASWDMAFKGTDGSDYVAGQIWGVFENAYYLLDQIHERLSFVETKAAVKALTKKWEKYLTATLIEDKANGPAIISALSEENEHPALTVFPDSEKEGIIAINPKGGKEARAHAITAVMKVGQVLLPDPETGGFGWVSGLVSELLRFPRAAHDDRVDALTQAVNWLEDNKPDPFILDFF